MERATPAESSWRARVSSSWPEKERMAMASKRHVIHGSRSEDQGDRLVSLSRSFK